MSAGARALAADARQFWSAIAQTRVGRALRVSGSVLGRSYDDGFIHAGNMAYLSLTTLFPFFVILAAVAGAFGRTDDGREAVAVFMAAVPADVGSALAGPITDLVSQQSGNLLTFGIVVGLWSATGFLETVRDIIRRAYGVTSGPAITHRLVSTAVVLGAVLLMLLAFALQFVLVGASTFVARVLPFAGDVAGWIGLSAFAPALIMFGALCVLFTVLTPGRYRARGREWPGALLTTLVWLGATRVLPPVLASVANYQMTYGSLAGVMISLLFFYVVGLGLVTGAHLNAVLAGVEPVKARERKGLTTT